MAEKRLHEIMDPFELDIAMLRYEPLGSPKPPCGILDGANHVDILKWLFFDDFPPGYVEDPIENFVNPYGVETYYDGRQFTADTLLDIAFRRCNPGVVKWLTATGFPSEPTVEF